MLTKLRIRNFQSHQDSVIELGSGVNVIVGQSNAGKTACVRSVNWALTNRPLGVQFIRNGQDEADVLLEEKKTNGTVVTVERIRSKTKNAYILNGATEYPFTAFGSNPPEDILQALNLRETNIQSQFAPYFLVFDSPGSVATQIRQVTGMEQIDKVSDIITSRIRSCKGSMTDKEAELTSAREKFSAISAVDLEKLELLINQADELESKKVELGKKHQKLQGLVDQLIVVQKAKINLPETRLQQISSDIIQKSEAFLQQRSLYHALQALIEGLRSACANKVVFPANLDEVLSRREQLVQQYNTLCTNLQKLYTIVEALRKCVNEGQGADDSVSKMEQEKQKLLFQLTTCPWCSSPLTKVTQKHLLEHSK
jgi:DNA repair exonuclease SbcCD ATPase subunit